MTRRLERATAQSTPILQPLITAFLQMQGISGYLAVAMNRPIPDSTPDPAEVLTKAVLSAASRLGLRSRQLGEVLGLSEASVSRAKSGRWITPDSKSGELALLFLRLFRSL